MYLSKKASQFTESVIREMTRLANQHQAINLAQGFPDFDPPEPIIEAACRALREGYNQYSVTWGAPELRRAIAERYARVYGLDIDPDKNIVVTCGATEAMISALFAVLDPGDEIIIFEPFYENYGPDGILCGAIPRYISLKPPDWKLDIDELAGAFNEKTRVLILNTPHNPTGRVFEQSELEAIAELCQRWDVLVITDEIYEYITYGKKHIPIATLPDMFERTITISGASKTFSATGWRVGWTVASETITSGIKKTHDFFTVGAPHPLQIAVASALRLPDAYFHQLAETYRQARDRMSEGLRSLGFQFFIPEGAYYLMADFQSIKPIDDVTFARELTIHGGVATVPGSSFFHRPEMGSRYIRFNFCKSSALLEQALQRLNRYLRGT